jgi:hypothetical protein
MNVNSYPSSSLAASSENFAKLLLKNQLLEAVPSPAKKTDSV